MATISYLPSAYRKLSPRELESRGLSRKSERWLNTNTGETISKRAYQKARAIGQYQKPELKNVKKQLRVPRPQISTTRTGAYTVYTYKLRLNQALAPQCDRFAARHNSHKYYLVWESLVPPEYRYAATNKAATFDDESSTAESIGEEWLYVSIAIMKGTRETSVHKFIYDRGYSADTSRNLVCKIIIPKQP